MAASDEVLERLRRLDSCAISDALDTAGLPGAVTGIAPMWSGNLIVAGRARTVRAAPRLAGGPVTHIASPLVATAQAADVVVIDNGGRMDVSCWGGLLAAAAIGQGVTAVVVDGACRDVPECEEFGLPVFARATVPVSARGRIVQQDMDVPIRIGGVDVCSGDVVVADRSGVVFVPESRAESILRLAERIVDREQRMLAAVRAGRSVVDVMHDSQFPTVAEDGS